MTTTTRGDERLGSYLLGPRIGKGAAGVVHSATSPAHPDPVAIKILRDDLSGDDKTVARFLREKRIFSAVDHPNVVKVHNLVAENDRLGIVMELLEGGDLRSLIAEGDLTPTETIELVRQVAEGLAHIHEVGVVHRDLKPANVLVSGEPGARQAKIADFGVSRLVDDAMTRTSSTIGTPLYMAPEVTDSRGAEAPSDVYALGAILFEMLIGIPPFDGDGALAVILAHGRQPTPEVSGVPAELSELIAAMLDKQPANRPTAVEVAAQLRALTPLIDDEMVPSAASPTAVAPLLAPEAAPPRTGGGHDTAPISPADRFVELVSRHRGAAVAAVLSVALLGTLLYAVVRDTAVEATGQTRTVFAPELREDVLLLSREWTLDPDGVLRSTTSITNLGVESLSTEHLETLPSGSLDDGGDRVDFTVEPIEIDDTRSTATFDLVGIEPDETITIGYRLQLDEEQRRSGLDELAAATRRTEVGVLAAANVTSSAVEFTALQLVPNEFELTVGAEPEPLRLLGRPVDAPEQLLELAFEAADWQVGNRDVAIIDPAGFLRPLAPGLTTVEARLDGLTASAAVLVRASGPAIAAGPTADDQESAGSIASETATPAVGASDRGSSATGAASTTVTTTPTVSRPTTTRDVGTTTTTRPRTSSSTVAVPPEAPTTATTRPTTSTTRATTTTTRATTTTTEATTTTTRATTTAPAPASVQVAIISGPRIVSVGPTSAVFSYTTNDVCATGSFVYRNKATGAFVGQWVGDQGCFGPVHEGRTAWGDIVLEPGTTYSVSITLDGQPSDGRLPTGVGRTTSAIEITTPG